jgi:hypothetical protein
VNILVDENIPNLTVSTLRSRGDDVLDVRGTSQQGIFDDALWSLAQTQGRILITTDKGFARHRSEDHAWNHNCAAPPAERTAHSRERHVSVDRLSTSVGLARFACGYARQSAQRHTSYIKKRREVHLAP